MTRFLAASLGVTLAVAALESQTPAPAPPPDGAAVFATHCASCHSGAPDSRAPSPEVLRLRSPDAIVLALVNGAMRVQGSRIGGAERRAVAEYLTGRALGSDVAGASTGRCTTSPPLADPATQPMWDGWGGVGNTRSQSAKDAGLTAEQVPRLALKWAIGFPDATSGWAQPSVASGRVFVGSHNGTVYSLDAKTGCSYWTFVASGGVRSGIAFGPPLAGGTGLTVYFGDSSSTAYALDGATGRELWRRKVEEHLMARVTGTPTLYDGRLYVPISSYEEAMAGDPLYECCTSRGSLSALDAKTGAILWKQYLVPEPQKLAKSAKGTQRWGPSGVSTWASPTVDAKRGVVYGATGNTFTGLTTQPLADAVVAFDLATGAIKWVSQTVPKDVSYVVGCRPDTGNPNCAEEVGPDYDFASAAILTTRPDGKDVIVIGQKSGMGYAMDPDNKGAVLWRYEAGQGRGGGAIMWSSTVDAQNAYFPVSGPGGLHAVDLKTGVRVWYAPPLPPKCKERVGCTAAQTAAISASPGVVFSGTNEGVLRAYSTRDGSVIWEYDTNREYQTVNGVPGRGASMAGPGPAIAGGMVFVNSGYGDHGGRPGNVLLAFGVE